MIFNSLKFLIFFPAVTLVYYLIPKRFRVIWLLVSSYYFYMSWNAKYAILLAICTAISYLLALAIGEADKIFIKLNDKTNQPTNQPTNPLLIL